jgi:outer membrane protein
LNVIKITRCMPVLALLISAMVTGTAAYAALNDSEAARLICDAAGIGYADCAEASRREAPGLFELYALAVHNTEKMKIEAENVIQARERRNQALGSFLPRVSLRASKLLPKRNDTESSFATTRTGVFLYARQPVMTGLDEWAGYKASGPDIRANYYGARSAATRLLYDVAYAYFRILQIEKGLASREEIVKLYGKNLQELNKRVWLGKSRQSDALLTRSQMHKVEADILSLKDELERARLDLVTLTGVPIGGRKLSGIGTISRPEGPGERLAASIEGRWDVKAAAEQVDLSEARLLAAVGGHFPSLYIEGGYRLYQPETIRRGLDYYVGLGAELPLFSGLIVSSKVNEMESALRQSRLRLREVRRIARQDVLDAWQSWDTSEQEVRAYAKALETAEENYRVVLRDYNLSLVTVLEVITALKTLQEAREDHVNTVLQNALNRVRLGIAVNEFAGSGVRALKTLTVDNTGPGAPGEK